jgi:hypothetical protein
MTRRSNYIESDGKAFFKPTTWPPTPPDRGDWIIVYGFPGLQRVPNIDSISFYSVVFSGPVSSISDRQFVLAAEDGPRLLEQTANNVPCLGNLGGMSGSPAFKLAPDGLSLVGIVYEAQDGRNATILCWRVDYINAKGVFDRGRLPPLKRGKELRDGEIQW